MADELYEQLAAIEHERWSHWQRYMHDQCYRLENGDLAIALERVQHWERQIDTQYENLSEREKQEDRNQVDRYWPLIKPLLAEVTAYKEAYQVAYEATYQGHSSHWDREGTHGANCPACIDAREARERCDSILAAVSTLPAQQGCQHTEAYLNFDRIVCLDCQNHWHIDDPHAPVIST